MQPLRIVNVVGARPQFVKLGPVSRAIAAHTRDTGVALEEIIVHTGQHYDANLSDVFFTELGLPVPSVNLNVGSGSHGHQTAAILSSMEDYLSQSRPDAVIVYGDTNTTLGACLAAAKLHQFVVHVEAGLRSYNRTMPEEINRVAVDHLADLLCAPTQQAMANLGTEGLSGRAIVTGDVMMDALEHNLARARSVSRILESCGVQPGKYAVATIHRADNTEERRLQQLVEIVRSVSADIVPVVFPVHPRTAHRFPEALTVRERGSDRLLISQPLGYLDMIELMAHAAVVITDSGGMQKEAFYLGVPCVTLRSETEWPETVDCGANVLVGADGARVLQEVRRSLGVDAARRGAFTAAARERYGAGTAGKTIVTAMVERLAQAGRA